MSEIKPCPFCGDTDLVFLTDPQQSHRWGYAECRCSARTGDVRVGGNWENDALNEWNTRAVIGFTDYQTQSRATALPVDGMGHPINYPTMGLTNEAGEVAGKVKKIFRDKGGQISDEDRQALKKELGDVLWYLTQICTELDVTLADVAETNLARLADRAKRNVIQGEGDNR